MNKELIAARKAFRHVKLRIDDLMLRSTAGGDWDHVELDREDSDVARRLLQIQSSVLDDREIHDSYKVTFLSGSGKRLPIRFDCETTRPVLKSQIDRYAELEERIADLRSELRDLEAERDCLPSPYSSGGGGLSPLDSAQLEDAVRANLAQRHGPTMKQLKEKITAYEMFPRWFGKPKGESSDDKPPEVSQ